MKPASSSPRQAAESSVTGRKRQLRPPRLQQVEALGGCSRHLCGGSRVGNRLDVDLRQRNTQRIGHAVLCAGEDVDRRLREGPVRRRQYAGERQRRYASLHGSALRCRIGLARQIACLKFEPSHSRSTSLSTRRSERRSDDAGVRQIRTPLRHAADCARCAPSLSCDATRLPRPILFPISGVQDGRLPWYPRRHIVRRLPYRPATQRAHA